MTTTRTRRTPVSHDACYEQGLHPATAAGRAACRKQRDKEAAAETATYENVGRVFKTRQGADNLLAKHHADTTSRVVEVEGGFQAQVIATA